MLRKWVVFYCSIRNNKVINTMQWVIKVCGFIFKFYLLQILVVLKSLNICTNCSSDSTPLLHWNTDIKFNSCSNVGGFQHQYPIEMQRRDLVLNWIFDKYGMKITERTELDQWKPRWGIICDEIRNSERFLNSWIIMTWSIVRLCRRLLVRLLIIII
jgi:hypothetical protein